jgi:phosphopantetheinyl transferase
MPLFFQQVIDNTTQLAIWKIEEEEAFFSQHVPLQRTITHPHKRLQHLSGRYLLKYLFPDFPISLIQIADTRKPYLKDEAYHFSISHCGDYAGVIVSKNRKVGIDIELFTPKIEKIAHKFVTDSEWAIVNSQSPVSENREPGNGNSNLESGDSLIPNSKFQITNPSTHSSQLTARSSIENLTLLWSCKEALFKWYGLGEVGFIRHMELKQVLATDHQQYELGFLFKKEKDLLLGLHSRFFNDLVLSYIVT